MYLTPAERAMIETTLFNLRYDMDCFPAADEMRAELAAMTDADLEDVLNTFLEDL